MLFPRRSLFILFAFASLSAARGDEPQTQTEYSAASQRLVRSPHAFRAIAVLPDGRSFITAGDSRWVNLHDGQGRITRQFAGHSDIVASLALSPDGRWLATASRDRTVRLWDLKSGEQRHVFDDATKWLNDIAFSPDGKLLAACGYDGKVRLWDVNARRLVHQAEVGVTVRCVEFSPRGDSLAAGDASGRIHRWKLPELAEPHAFEAHKESIRDLAFSPRGDRLLTVGEDDRAIVWDVATKKLVVELTESGTTAHDVAVWSAAYSPGGDTIATADYDGQLKVWSPAGKHLSTHRGHADVVGAVAYTPDGLSILTAGYDGVVDRWNARLPLHASLAVLPVTAKTWAAAVSPDGTHIAVGGRKGFISIWNLATRTRVRVLERFPGTVDCLEFSGDGKHLAAAGWRSKEAKVWSVDDGRVINTFTAEDSVRSLSFSPGGTRLVLGCKDHRILWRNIAGEDGEQTDNAHKLPVYDVEFSPDGRYLASASGEWTKIEPGVVKLWDAATREEVASFTGHRHAVRAVSFHPAGNRLVSVDQTGVVKVWDVPGKREIKELRNSVGGRAVAYSPDGKQIAVGLQDGTINLWDVDSADLIKRYGGADDIFGVRFSVDGSTLIAADGDAHLVLWQVGELNDGTTAAHIRKWPAVAESNSDE